MIFPSGARALLVLAGLVVVGSAFPPQTAHAAKTERLLILPLEHELGDDAASMRPIEKGFREEAEALQRFHVLPRESSATLLESVRSLGLDCGPGDVECLTKAGVIMELDLLAVLRAARGGERVIVSAILVDVATGRTRGSVSRTLLPGDRSSKMLRSAVVELLAPDLYVGAIELSTAQPGASVRVDGALRGTTPLSSSIDGLAPGEHVVHIEKPGLPPIERVVLVKALESTSLVVDLAAPAAAATTSSRSLPAGASPSTASSTTRAPAPFPVLPVVFGSVGAVSAVTAAGTVVGAFLLNERLKDTSLPPADRKDARTEGQMLIIAGTTMSVIAVIAGGAATAAVLAAP